MKPGDEVEITIRGTIRRLTCKDKIAVVDVAGEDKLFVLPGEDLVRDSVVTWTKK